MISTRDNKTYKFTKGVGNLEQMLHEPQSGNFIATNTSELLKIEADKLMKQYSCLVISGVELPAKKAIIVIYLFVSHFSFP